MNGEIFTKTDLENRQVARLRDSKVRRSTSRPTTTTSFGRLLDEITPEILVDAVDEMLVVQRGKELGYTLGDEQFKSVLERHQDPEQDRERRTVPGRSQAGGLTLADLRRNLERQMIMQRVQQNEVVNKVAMTEDEARAYYDAHSTEFTTPATVTLREILISPPADSRGVNVAADEEAKARADAIRARAIAGEAFEKLAADLSDSASQGQRRSDWSASSSTISRPTSAR